MKQQSEDYSQNLNSAPSDFHSCTIPNELPPEVCKIICLLRTPNHSYELLLISNTPTPLALANCPSGNHKAVLKKNYLLSC